MSRTTPIFFIFGRSGIGKTTLLLNSDLSSGVSYTSRKIRDDEEDGVDYHFKTRKWMLDHKDEFKIGFKKIKEDYYAYSDDDLKNKDGIVILAEDALKHFRNGVPCIFIHYWGEVYRQRPGRDLGKEMTYIQTHIDMIRTEVPESMFYSINNKYIKAAIKKLESLHKRIVIDKP